MSAPDRRKLVDRQHRALSIRRQCELLGIARSGVYRPPRAANDNDLPLMRRIDELFTTWPFLGSRRLTALLRAEGHAAEPGVVRGHHLHPARPRLPVSGGDHGLGDPGGAGVAAVEHYGRVVLR